MPKRKYDLKDDSDRQRRAAQLKATANRAEDTSGDTVPLTAKLPPDLKAWVTDYAAETGKSASRVVREALEAYRATAADAPPVEPRPR